MIRNMRAPWGVAALGLALAVAGCGQTQSERTSGGAAAGAAAGAGVGALGGPVGALAGAAVGAGAGAVTGATTSPQEVNLGRPPWTNPEARVPGVNDEAPRGSGRRGAWARTNVREAQQELARAGYDPGPVDGVWGAQTARAARDYQRANNLTQTGRLDSATRAALRGGSRPAGTTGSTGTVPPSPPASGTGSTGAATPSSPANPAPATR